LQTSHSREASSVTGELPAATAVLIVAGKRIVALLYPKFISGPTGIRAGAGQSGAPTETPAEVLHVYFGGSPESPGFFQYTCHSGSGRSSTPRVIVEPGATVW
jgi:hypothetical protein